MGFDDEKGHHRRYSSLSSIAEHEAEVQALLSDYDGAKRLRRAGGSQSMLFLLPATRRARIVLGVIGTLLVAALTTVTSFARFVPPPEPVIETRVYPELEEACATNDWRPGLYVNATLHMGLNNLRTEMATVFRWAFDAGAGVVLPRITLRNNATLNAWNWESGHNVTDADIYFDIDRLRRDFARWCPQMNIRDANDMTDLSIEISDDDRGWREILFGKGEFRTHMNKYLAKNNISNWSPTSNVVFYETLLPYAAWFYPSDDFDADSPWFDIIDWAPRLHNVTDQLRDTPSLHDGYIGIHLRVERDVYQFWANFEEQVLAYRFWIERRPEKAIYLACGDDHFTALFREQFPSHRVYTKWDLAQERPEIMDKLVEFTFDEMASVDYQLMREANLVMGIGRSSFAYLLGVDRRVNRTSHFSDTLHDELLPTELREPRRTFMVGDANTMLLPPILDEYYESIP